MRKTPEDISKCGNQFEIEKWLLTASVEEICGFFTYTSTESHDFEFAKVALSIRIAKSAERTNRILVWLTIGIFLLTVILVAFALLPVV